MVSLLLREHVFRCFGVIPLAFVMLLSAREPQAQEPWRDARLFDAVAAGDAVVVKAALELGKDPNTASPFWGSLLKHAANHGQMNIIRLLLSRGARPKGAGNEGILLGPIQESRVDIVGCLVEAGADLNKPEGAQYWQDYVAAAVRAGSLELLKYLLEHGANPNSTGAIAGETALHVAAARGDVNALDLLLRAGADVNQRDWNGLSALMHACKRGHEEAVRILLGHGADVTFEDGYERNAAALAKTGDGTRSLELRGLCAGLLSGERRP
jgi:ankyrin repeat protein